MRSAVLLLALAALAAPATATADVDLTISAAHANPGAARTGEAITITITATNSGDKAPAFPVYMRIEARGAEFGTSQTTCPQGAEQTRPEECRLAGPLKPGESATMSI